MLAGNSGTAPSGRLIRWGGARCAEGAKFMQHLGVQTCSWMKRPCGHVTLLTWGALRRGVELPELIKRFFNELLLRKQFLLLCQLFLQHCHLVQGSMYVLAHAKVLNSNVPFHLSWRRKDNNSYVTCVCSRVCWMFFLGNTRAEPERHREGEHALHAKALKRGPCTSPAVESE